MIYSNLFRTQSQTAVTDEIIKATDGDIRRGETGSYIKNTTYEKL